LASRDAAMREGAVVLADWVRLALIMARPQGSVTLIHRADRLDAILATLSGQAGDISVYPLWPGAGKPAKRVIVRARKGVAAPACLCPGMILHQPDGGFSAAAEAVLRDAAALRF
jgi:tRNA1(Val) A37 N6-methylase TrmN6